MINGKPSIAMIAAFCCARAAMAATNVKTRLRLTPPKQLMKIKSITLFIGEPRSNKNNNTLANVITSISTTLNNNLARIKSFAPAME